MPGGMYGGGMHGGMSGGMNGGMSGGMSGGMYGAPRVLKRTVALYSYPKPLIPTPTQILTTGGGGRGM